MRKTLLFLFLLSTFISSAQIITFTDVNFKDKLLQASPANIIAKNSAGVAITIDANNDDEIQVAEAAAVWELNVHEGGISSIVSLTGLEHFTNLRYFNCTYNAITSIDISALIHLEELWCGDNLITYLDFAGLTSLKKIFCAGAGNENALTGIDLSGLVNLEELDCSSNFLTSLDVSGLTSLKILNCTGNSFTTLSLAGLTNLEDLDCGFGSLTTLDATGLTNLENLNCAGANVTSLTVSGLPNLKYLYCYDNELQTLNTTNLPQLIELVCRNNGIDQIDVSDSYQFNYLDAANNNLTYLNIKNGSPNDQYFVVLFNPDLHFICIDEEDIPTLTDYLQSFAITDIEVNTYCSATPGGLYSTITGALHFDADGNGCSTDDAATALTSVAISDGTNTGATFTNNNGSFNFYVEGGTYMVTPNVNSNLFTVQPQLATITINEAGDAVPTQDFCLSANGVHPDVEVVIVSVVTPNPGFDAYYKIIYKNSGNQPASGTVSLTYNDNLLNLAASVPAATGNDFGSATWSYVNLQPFETKIISVTVHVNSPTDTPAVNDGDVLVFSAAITQEATDDTPANNTFELNSAVQGSFDPNDKTCLEGDSASDALIGSYLHYNINFENTGTAPATFIVVKDEIDTTQFDVSSLEVLDASHSVTVTVTNNIVEFRFDAINLAPLQKGNVLFKIKTLATLQTGDAVMNKANIYFDYNFPIETNEATTAFETLSSESFVKDASVAVYPNPTGGAVTITAHSFINSIEVYDVQGRLLQSSQENETQAVLDISLRAAGIYFVKVSTQDGIKVEKVVKK